MSSLSSSNLPPADPGVFFATASAIIDAPIDDVWAMLLDFPRYPDWYVQSRDARTALTLTYPAVGIRSGT
jgi:uncharacterized protein YndB with AHSA1/START domain